MTDYTKAGISIKRAYTVDEVEAELGGEDEMNLHKFNGHELAAPWWAEVAVVDQNHMMRVFPGAPYRKTDEETGKWEWRSSDCENFQSHGIIIAEMEVNTKVGYAAFDGVLLSLNLLDHKDVE